MNFHLIVFKVLKNEGWCSHILSQTKNSLTLDYNNALNTEDVFKFVEEHLPENIKLKSIVFSERSFTLRFE